VKEQLEQRLKSLREEFDNGQKMLADVQRQEANLKETLLRISGAIQVIEEELAKTNGNEKKTEE
jgi:septal ring factor EnvC (AmiA/AmiB activator)